MIPFFRKIRKKMADDNRPLKYMRYAIGEIILVVVGILIALQINNWNENNKEQQKVRVHLNSLKTCLQEDKIWLDNLRSIELFRYHSMKKLLDFSEVSNLTVRSNLDDDAMDFEPMWIWNEELPVKSDSTFVHVAFSWTGRHLPMIPNMQCIEEIKNDGLFSKIKNKEIKSRLANYYRQLDFRLGVFESRRNLDEEAWEVSLRNNGVRFIDVSTHEDPLSLIRNNIENQLLLKNLAGGAIWRAEGANHLLNLLVENMELIDQELEQR
jgi:hypothetical protein